MRKPIILLLTITGLTLSHPQGAHSATYYLSSSRGNDTNDGLSEQSPWQSLAKVNSTALENNSQLLLKRGDIFRGSLDINNLTDLHVDAYGAGNTPPIISGSVAITNWQPTTHPQLPTPVYEAEVSTLPLTQVGIRYLFVNGELMTKARYPNVASPADTHWLKIDQGSKVTGVGQDRFRDAELAAYNKPDNYWTGATLRIRDYSWTFNVLEVTGYQAATGQLTAKGLGTQYADWGYFLENKLTELDHPGEWYYDAQTHKVYLYPKGGTNPNQQLVEGATLGTGWKIKTSPTTIANLTFRHFGRAIQANATDVTIQQCHFEHNQSAVGTYNPTNLLITENTFDHQLKNTLVLQAAKDFEVQNAVISHNQITNTAMYPAYGSDQGQYNGIAINAMANRIHIHHNWIENVSWNGMYLTKGGYYVVEHNVVRKALQLLNDGGAISVRSGHNQIRNNLLSESQGNVDDSDGCAFLFETPCWHHPSYGMGIGADGASSQNLIEGNTIFNNPHNGIRMAFNQSEIRNNVIYHNQNQIRVEESQDSVISGNIFYSLRPNQRALAFKGSNQELQQLDQNSYCNPYSDIITSSYSLPHWQQQFPAYDQHSTECTVQFPEYQVTSAGANLLNESSYEVILKPDGSPTTRVTNRFEIQENQLYRLKLQVVANGFGSIKLSFNEAPRGGKTTLLGSQTLAYATEPRNYEVFLRSSLTSPHGVLVFSSRKSGADSYQMYSVAFEPVEAQGIDPTQYSVLLVNPTTTPKIFNLQGTHYLDLTGNTVTESFTLQPFASQVLIYSEGILPTSYSMSPAPTILAITSNSTSIMAEWKSVIWAQGYRLYYAAKTNISDIKESDIHSIKMGNQNNISVELSQLRAISGEGFCVAIKAYNDFGESHFSNVKCFAIQPEFEIIL